MSVQLEIHDGSPWWLSPDIWTVPGNDPQGSPSLPIAGQPCYVWARVTNNGTDAVDNATVRFYWANPSTGFDRNTANYIGNANVSLKAGETQDVLCLVAWTPTFVNDGHECVLAEAFHPSLDPLPASPDFSVPTDRHVAQRNLSVVMMAMMERFSLSFEIVNPIRVVRSFSVKTKLGTVEELRPLLQHINVDVPLNAKGQIRKLGFVKTIGCNDHDSGEQAERIENLKVGSGARVGLSVVGELEGEAALLHVLQEADSKQVGGLSILLVRNHKSNGGKE